MTQGEIVMRMYAMGILNLMDEFSLMVELKYVETYIEECFSIDYQGFTTRGSAYQLSNQMIGHWTARDAVGMIEEALENKNSQKVDSR